MGEGETPDTQATFWAPLIQFRHSIHTYEVSMKARPKGHIAIKLYKVEESHPTTTTKNSFHKCYVAALCNNRSDNSKDLMFEGSLPKVSFSTVHFPTHIHLL